MLNYNNVVFMLCYFRILSESVVVVTVLSPSTVVFNIFCTVGIVEFFNISPTAFVTIHFVVC